MDLDQLRNRLEKGSIRSEMLLCSAKVLDRSSRDVPAFNDPKYFPFYYYLGQQCNPIVVAQIGSKLGLIGACFLQSCKSVKKWLVIDNYKKPPTNVILSNLKMFSSAEVVFECVNGELVINDRCDVCFLTEKYDLEYVSKYLEILWAILENEGLLVVDYIHDKIMKDMFIDFCDVRNREPVFFDTRYGLGIVKK